MIRALAIVLYLIAAVLLTGTLDHDDAVRAEKMRLEFNGAAAQMPEPARAARLSIPCTWIAHNDEPRQCVNADLTERGTP